MDVLFLILVVSTGTILGNEFSIGFLIHPALSRTDAEHFLPAIQVFAKLFGKIMPFWGLLLLFLASLGRYRSTIGSKLGISGIFRPIGGNKDGAGTTLMRFVW